jgi:D-3-phosphoglycerate dehydrogenase
MLSSPAVFIAQSTMYPEALRVLEEGAVVTWGLPENRGRAPELAIAAAELVRIRARLLEVLPVMDGIFGHYPCDATLFEAAKRLRVVMTPSSGAEHIDIEAATAHGVAVVNAAGANYVPVAEHIFGLGLSLLRQIAIADRQAHRELRLDTNARQFELHGLPTVLNGKTLGVVGFGFIGREVARIGRQGFRMRAIAFDPYFDQVEARRQDVDLVSDLVTLLRESDVLCVSCPLTSETRNLIGGPELSLMKPTAILLNASRGGTVVTDDLVAALKAGTIAAAGVDVTEPEPLPAGHPLFALDNVVLTPHVGGASAETLVQQSIQTARDGLMVLEGKKPFHLVNPAVWPQLKTSAC